VYFRVTSPNGPCYIADADMDASAVCKGMFFLCIPIDGLLLISGSEDWIGGVLIARMEMDDYTTDWWTLERFNYGERYGSEKTDKVGTLHIWLVTALW
jgi:hypothetical protein